MGGCNRYLGNAQIEVTLTLVGLPLRGFAYLDSCTDTDDEDEDHVLAQLVTVGHPGTLARVSGSSASDTGAAASSNGLSQASLVAGEGAGIGDEWKHLQDVRQELAT